MATFELRLNHDICIGGHNKSKGQLFILNMDKGITPVNLFQNSRCADTVLKQLSAQGLDLPKNSPLLNKGHWDIKMK